MTLTSRYGFRGVVAGFLAALFGAPANAALFQHLDASVAGSVISSGGTVTTWQDQANSNDATYVSGAISDTGTGVLLDGASGDFAEMQITSNVDMFAAGGYSVIIAYRENGEKPPAANNWNDLLTNTTVFGDSGKFMIRSANGGSSGTPGRLQVASGGASLSDSDPIASAFNDGNLSVVAVDVDAAGNFYTNTNRGLSGSGSGGLPTGATATSAPLLLGHGTSGGRWFNGVVHEIKIWDESIGAQALDAEISALHQKWVPEPTAASLLALAAGVGAACRRSRS